MKILMIGGDKQFAHAINHELGEKYYKIRYVPDGDSGLELATQYHFDLIVLSWSTPKTDNLNVIKTLRQQERRIPILLVVKYESMTSIILPPDSGRDVCLSNPIYVHDVISKIKELISRSEWKQYLVIDIYFDDVSQPPKKTKEIYINHKNCRTSHTNNGLWECISHIGVPCAHRAHLGADNYCLHKDQITFSPRPNIR